MGGVESQSQLVVEPPGKTWLWLGCPVFTSRYAHWWLTRRLLSWLWMPIRRLARWPVTWVVFVGAALWEGPPLYKKLTGHTTHWEVVGILLVAAGFVWLMMRSRRRTVFQDFPNCTGPDVSGTVPGLGAYLANEVDRLGALYRTVRREHQDAKGPAHPGEAIAPALELDDTAEFLKDAVSPDAKVSFGGVNIPIGSILGLVARLLRGPQITGSLHREGDRLILLGSYAGGGRSRSWRVQGKPGSAEADDQGRWDLHPLVEEMATRMLADLTLGSTTKFRAVSAFTKAVRASLEDGGLERPPLLRLVEVKNRLLDAIAEDGSFDLAWYNLGVTLLQLRDEEMARGVFTRARSDNPSRWQATYALATLPGDIPSRLLLCEQVLKVHPGPGAEAQAHDLRGKLYAEQAELLDAVDGAQLRKKVVGIRKLAARRAWRALRRAEWSAPDDETSVQLEGRKRLAAACLTNLAHSYKDYALAETRSRQKRRAARRAQLLLREAGRLARLDPQAHRELGVLHEELENWKRAAREYFKALRVLIDDPALWVAYVRAAARADLQPADAEGVKALLTLAPLVEPKLLTGAAKCFRPDSEIRLALIRLARLHRMISLMITGAENGRPFARAQLTRLKDRAREVSELGISDGGWSYFRCAMAWCQLEPNPATSPSVEAVAELLRATDTLAHRCSAALQRKNFHYVVAQDLAAWGRLAQALDQAEKAIRADPFDPRPWHLLGDLRQRRAEFDAADECYLAGLRWVGDRKKPTGHGQAPDSDPPADRGTAADCRQLVALTASLTACRLKRLRNRAAGKSAGTAAGNAVRDAGDRLEQILPALESSDLWHRTKTHYWLGQVAVALDGNDQATVHFEAAAQPTGPSGQPSNDDVSLIALFLKAGALMKRDQLEEAQATFDRVATAIGALDRDGGERAAPLDMVLDEPPTLDEVLVHSMLGGAAARARRRVDLHRAKHLARMACERLPALPENERIRGTGQAEALLGQIEAVRGHDDRAIAHLRRSVSLVSDAATYASLAEAYDRAAQHCRKQDRQREFRRLLEDCGRNIQLIANSSNHPDHIGDLLAQVDALIAGPHANGRAARSGSPG
jgi:tetratricopeptide (TPR) repeat protein